MRTLATALAVALLCGAGVAAAQQLQLACDENTDGFVDAKESSSCMERRFDEIAAGQEMLTEELLTAKAGGERGPVFAEVDENG